MHASISFPLLTTRDEEIVKTLVHRVRVLSLQQVTRTWWAGCSPATVRVRLNELENLGLIRHFQSLCHPELPLQQPVFTWAPGEAEPNCGRFAYRLRARWFLSPVNTHFIFATREAGHRYGGFGGRIPRDREVCHDLHVACVYLRFASVFPELASVWRSEARIARDRERGHERLPDAVIERANGPRVIEFGGEYSKEKLEGFHDYWDRLQVPYEVW